jgi:endonuclease IV
VIHCQHYTHGVNFADREKHYLNYSAILTALKFADELNSKAIIFHPGEAEHGTCSLSNTISFVSRIGDSRLFVENMPSGGAGSRVHFGARVEEIGKVIAAARTGLCLDFSHSAVAGASFNAEPYEYSKKFLTLNPKLFHLSDARIAMGKGGVDEHLHFGQGNLNLSTIKRMLPKDALITLETPMDIEKRKSDIIRIRQFN